MGGGAGYRFREATQANRCPQSARRVYRDMGGGSLSNRPLPQNREPAKNFFDIKKAKTSFQVVLLNPLRGGRQYPRASSLGTKPATLTGNGSVAIKGSGNVRRRDARSEVQNGGSFAGGTATRCVMRKTTYHQRASSWCESSTAPSIGDSFKGRTRDFDSRNRGSSPRSSAKDTRIDLKGRFCVQNKYERITLLSYNPLREKEHGLLRQPEKRKADEP